MFRSRGLLGTNVKFALSIAFLCNALIANISCATAILDSTFGSNGMAVTPGALNENWIAIAAQEDGKILTAGDISATDLSEVFAVGRYSADGLLDTSFGSMGIASFDLNAPPNPSRVEYLHSIAVQPDGKIVGGGSIGDINGGSYEGLVVRLLNDGTLDPGFGSVDSMSHLAPGFVHLSLGAGGSTLVDAVFPQPDNKLLVALDFSNQLTLAGSSTDYQLALVRLNDDGSRDLTFGSGGEVHYEVTPGVNSDRSVRVSQLDNGDIQFSGESEQTGGAINLMLLRVHQDGTPVVGFGVNGAATQGFTGGTPNIARDAVTLTDGSVFAIGFTIVGGVRYQLVWRMDASGAPLTGFGTNGVALGPVECNGNQLMAQSDGSFIVTGGIRYSSSGHYDFAIWRLLDNGSFDTNFGSNAGVASTDITGTGGSSFAYASMLQTGGKIVLAGFSAATTGANDFTLARFDLNTVDDIVFRDSLE